MVTRLLLGMFLIGIASAASGFEIGPPTPINTLSAVTEAELSGLLDLESERREGNQCSNLVIAAQWLRFSAPETFRAARTAVDQAKAVASQFRQQQELQQSWVREKLDFAVERCRASVNRLAATWLPSHDSSDVLIADALLDKRSFLFDQESPASAYWNYYKDCDRWGVELTRSIQRRDDGNLSEAVVPAGVGDEGASISSDLQNANLVSVFDVLSRASQWLGQTLRHIEFAATESRASSRKGVSTLIHQ